MKRKRLRLQNFDYSAEGYYFVTICVQDFKDYFGFINDGVVNLNDAGKMVESIWKQMPNKYDGIDIDEFVFMPNHMHGIIIIGPAQGPARTGGPPCPPGGNKLSLSDYIHRFKSLTTALYRKNFSNGITSFHGKLWHRSFYDRVIRNDRELNAIRQYIRNNPQSWGTDKNNPSVGAELAPAQK